MSGLTQDLRYGLRMLLKNPGFTVVAVLTLALGIGANTAMFSLLNTYLFRTLPYPQSNRLVRIFRTSPHSQSWPHSPGNFFAHHDQNDVFQTMAAYNFTQANLANPGETAERLQGLNVTADFFDILEVQPLLGRVFTTEEYEPGADREAVLSHRFWLNRFGGDSNVVGTTMRLDGQDVRIIGVMPPLFEHPLLWGNIDLWRPLAFTPQQKVSRNSNYLRSFGRLKPGVSIEQAQQAMSLIAANLANEHPENAAEGLRLEPLSRSTSDNVSRNVMWFTFGLAGFVLLISCANLANLQLVRTSARSKEYAVRSALGAARARLIRQSLTESLAVSLIGGAVSLVLAIGAVEFISRSLFSQLPGAKVALDFSVFGYALLASVATGVLFGIVPAWLASRTDLSRALKQNMRGSGATASHNRLRHSLIVGEVAFALVLLAGAGLFLRGLQKFGRLDPGWSVDGLLTAQVSLQGSNYSTPEQRIAFYHRLEDSIASLPGVKASGLSNSLPVWGFNSSGSFRAESEPEPAPGQWPEVFMEPVTPQYFEALGVRVLDGRTFNADDVQGKPDVVIVNETLAKRFWPNESAVGKRFGRPGPQGQTQWIQIVGVVSDLSFPASLNEPYTKYQSYRPLYQQAWGGINVELRTSAAPESVAGALRAAVAEIDSTQPVNRIRTAQSLIDQGLGNISLLGTLLGAFAILGLVLAAVGIFGVTSYSVMQRTSEIGIRMALGARGRDVLLLVMRKGALLVVGGAVIGFGGAFAIGRLLVSLIPALPTRDPITLAVVFIGLLFVALLACYIPARRATKVDPMIALRYE